MQSASTHPGALSDYEHAYRSREVDKAEQRFNSSGKAKFCILGGGMELANIAAANNLQPGDWMRGYYRNIAAELALGNVTVRQLIAQVIGDTEGANDPASGGRMMGRHYADRLLNEDGDLRDLTQQVNRAADVSSTASQMSVALGLARASQVFKENPEITDEFPGLSDRGREVTLVTIGDSSMAEGISWEAVNQAVVQGVPLVISVLDNGYGISVTRDRQIAKDSISKALSGMEPDGNETKGLKIIGPVNGWDYEAVNAAYAEAFDWAREHGQPALVHCMVTQPFGHSSSGDHKRYKSPERLWYEVENDPITQMRKWLISEGIANEHQLSELEASIISNVKNEAQEAWDAYYNPILELGAEALQLIDSLISDLVVETREIESRIQSLRDAVSGNRGQFLTRGEVMVTLRNVLTLTRRAIKLVTRRKLLDLHESIQSDGEERYSSKVYAEGIHSARNLEYVGPQYSEESSTDRPAHIVAAGLASMMSDDPRVVVFGEDTGSIGGVIKCTSGLQGGKSQVGDALWENSPALNNFGSDTGFGESRVWDTGIAEATIVGVATGLAIAGLRPVAEIQYEDYAIYGLQPIVDELSCLRHRTDGGQEAPVLIRIHGNQLLGMWHSGSHKGMFLSTSPGLCLMVPRDPVQAVGLMRAALRGKDPVVSIESLMSLYGGNITVPDNLDELCIPLGHSELLREIPTAESRESLANQITIVTYGYNCNIAMEAASNLSKLGIDVEVVDLQTLEPLDVNGVALLSILKTGKVLFLGEDIPNGASGILMSTILLDRRVPAGDSREGHRIYDCIERMDRLTAAPHKPPYGADGKVWGKAQVSDVVHKVCQMLDELDNGQFSSDGLPRVAW